MATRTRTRPTTKPAAKPAATKGKPERVTDGMQDFLDIIKAAPGKPGSPENEAYLRDAHEQRVRAELRDNAFSEMSRRMFREVEIVIHEEVTEAATYFDQHGRIRDNRLSELLCTLTRATALSSALLMAGECLR